MHLSFQLPYLSISEFPQVELPDFTLITGPNGVGKSHFLKSLEMGYIQSDIVPGGLGVSNEQIRMFDWSTLVPQGTGYFGSETIKSERIGLYKTINSMKNQLRAVQFLNNFFSKYKIPKEISDNIRLIESIDDVEIKEKLSNIVDIETFRNDYEIAVTQTSQAYLDEFSPHHKNELLAISDQANKYIFSLNEADITSALSPSWGSASLFQQSFARLFVSYRDIYLANRLRKLSYDDGKSDAVFLTDEQFIEKHGSPPWDFVNTSLADADLGFSINKPNLYDYAMYSPQLTKDGSSFVIPFSDLSSGEKVLMSFAFCVYYASDKRQISQHPKIILLDEVDAPLHPSMSKNLIKTITETLVSNFGIKVIATTHSPSTVALAPESSIFVMRTGSPGLHKVTKSEALNVLTVGVPTIALSFDGRRQVFVESHSDAKTYDALYKCCKPKLNSELSLEFIPTGTRSKTGEENNAGCDIVKRIVDQLAAAGNNSVFGLIDWDGENQPNKRISVLAYGTRNGLENVLLDPLLVAGLICREYPQHRKIIGMSDDLRWPMFIALESDEMQPFVSKICQLIRSGEIEEEIQAEYSGGFSLLIDPQYMKLDDHELERRILSTFPGFNKISKSAGGGSAGRLMQHIIENVIRDNPKFMPIEIETTFKELLERPAHHQ